MSSEQALLHCTYGWGKTCCLYYDSIEIAGKSYNLKDLTSIHPSYRVVFGVPSARLELSFGLEHLVLRGIADLHSARLVVSHLQPYCSPSSQAAPTRSRSSRARNLARAQARAWERTNKLPAIPTSPGENPLSAPLADTSGQDAPARSDFVEEQPTDQPLLADAVPKAPIEDTSLTPGETLEAFAQLAGNLSTYADPLPGDLWQPPRTPRFHPPLHSVHLVHPDHKFDSNSIPVPVVKSSVLPIIHVPVRLQHGECAHYSIGAILCSDRIASAERATYPLLDNGLMILTNRRVLYVGKRCQFTLAYTHLWYVSLLHTAIALHIEGQFRRIIIELEHPQEWASRIELLSFIARRERPEPPTLSVAAVPGLNITVKRQAVKPPPTKKPALAERITVPLLSERVASKVVDVETIELVEESVQACSDQPTLDFSASAPLERVRSNTPRTAGQPDIAASPTQEFALAETRDEDIAASPTQEFALAETRDEDIAASPTQEFALSETRDEDIVASPTQEFALAGIGPSPEEAPTQAIGCEEEIAKLATREFLPGQEMDDDDDRTIHLYDRKLSQLRTVSLSTLSAPKRSDLEQTEKRRSPARVSQRSS